MANNERTSAFIDEVKRWCKENQISQKALAKKLDVSNSLITEWFKGRRFPVGEEILHLQSLMTKKKSD